VFIACLLLAVLFKLMQMQKVDESVLERLIDRYFELDEDDSGSLSLGVEVPNKEQVAEMKAMTEGTGMTLQEAWKKHLTNHYRLRAEVFLPDITYLNDNGEEFELELEKSPESSESKGVDFIGDNSVDVNVMRKALPELESQSTAAPSVTPNKSILDGIKFPDVFSLGFKPGQTAAVDHLGTRI
jgi:hypothetical protein